MLIRCTSSRPTRKSCDLAKPVIACMAQNYAALLVFLRRAYWLSESSRYCFSSLQVEAVLAGISQGINCQFSRASYAAGSPTGGSTQQVKMDQGNSLHINIYVVTRWDVQRAGLPELLIDSFILIQTWLCQWKNYTSTHQHRPQTATILLHDDYVRLKNYRANTIKSCRHRARIARNI